MTAPDRPLRLGLVGRGFLARTRVRNYRRSIGVELAAVCASTADGARAFADEVGIAQSFGSLEEMLAQGNIDAVDLCVPNPLHRPLGEQAAAAGKHVVCTKPLVGFPGASADEPGDPVPDAEALRAACESAGVSLCYGENWIYAPSIQRALGLHRSSGGVLLEMHGFEAHSGSHAEYAKRFETAGGGALLRLGSHPIGVMCYLKAEEGRRLHGAPTRVVAVTAECADLSRTKGTTEANTRIATGWQDVENWGLSILHFEDGSRGIAHGSDNSLGGMQSKLELRSSNALHHCRLSPNDLLSSYAAEPGTFGDSYVMEKASTDAGWNTPIPDEDWSSGQLGMCQEFATDLREGRAPQSDGWLGVEVMRVLSAAYRSARDGRRVEIATGN